MTAALCVASKARSWRLFIGKPNTFLIKEALKVMKLKKENVVLVGDQLETDILAAKNFKMNG